MKLQLYYYEQCPFCVRVLNKIEQLELKEHIELKNTLTDRDNAKFHIEKTGRSTVPCLYINDSPMFESHDINVWLEKNANKIKG